MADTIILAAIPFFFLLIFIEIYVDRRRKAGFVRYNDAFGSLALGTWSLSTKLLFIGAGGWLYTQIFNGWQWQPGYEMGLGSWIVLFVAYDLCYYFAHRAGHEINLFWAAHSIHHQSEEYNLTTALRQTSSGGFNVIFYVPLYMWGVPIEAIATVGALNLIYQYWVHTRHINTLGWMEWVFVTPSNHRVHHGQNPEYIDKNHGGVFIIWDRLFGTFQPELPGVETIYGVRRSLNNFSPFAANIQVWWSLLLDAIRAKRWRDKLTIWFKPTGWRPADQEIANPIRKTDLDNFVAFNPESTNGLKVYTLIQLVVAMGLGTWFTSTYTSAPYHQVMLMWLVVSVPLVTSAKLLQGEPLALIYEAVRLPMSLLAVYGLYSISPQFWFALAWLGLSAVALVALTANQGKGAAYE